MPCTCSLLVCLSGTGQLWQIFQQSLFSLGIWLRFPYVSFYPAGWEHAVLPHLVEMHLKAGLLSKCPAFLCGLQFSLISVLHCDRLLFRSFNMETFARLLAEEMNCKSLGWLPCKKGPWAVFEPRMLCAIWVTAETIGWSISGHMTVNAKWI